MLRRIQISALLLITLYLLSGCSLIWPAEQPASPPIVEQPSNPVLRTGSFVPSVIPTSGEDLRLRTVYLMDYQGRYLVPYLISVPKVEGIARQVVSSLIESAENRQPLSGTEFRLPLPANTTVVGMTVREEMAIIDFSQEFLGFADANHERLAIDAVVYSLTEFDNIERVEIRVNGNPLSTLPSGLPLSYPLTRSARPLNLEVSAGVAELTTSSLVHLYFSAKGPGSDLVYFVPVTRAVAGGSNDVLAAHVLELIQGPQAGSNLFADLPANTELRSIYLDSGVVHVDFSASLNSSGGTLVDEQAMIGALVLTLTDILGADSVRITVNGQPLVLPGGTNLSQPVIRPLFVNPFIL